MLKTLRAVRFLFMAPVILVVLFVISRMTTAPGEEGWFRWAALGIGIAWLFSLIRVLQGVVVMGGLAALMAWLLKRGSQPQQQQQYQTWQSGPPPPPHTPAAEEVPPSRTPPPPPWSEKH